MFRKILGVFLFLNVTVASANNAELQKLHDEDQASRMAQEQDHKDDERRIRVLEILASGGVVTPKDKINAALVLQHTGFTLCNKDWKSISAENYLLAHLLVKSAIKQGAKGAELLYAQTIDRYLAMTQGTQKYGTNVLVDLETGEQYYPEIDRSVSDEERAKYGVDKLEVLLARHPERKPKI
ncbi:hypothetical protein [Aliikangiella sp. G2MR2-5]|uniref:hypothetical protein n=1 Tax=Aliikangiella sp. G2MR2-5 TaxID=2788943 RepID=UPI0018A8B8E9|nr:hypothetical protein [Aliikangiella sp. G2MR2-5]